MRDPEEGLTPDGFITTGVHRNQAPEEFAPVLRAIVEATPDDVSLYVYGSVATGQARVGSSDVDVVAVGMDPARTKELGDDLTLRFASVTREVAIGAWSADELGSHDAGHGNRVFLKHYCAWLAGPDLAEFLPRFAGDAHAARGFNGDIAVVLRRWQQALDQTSSPDDVTALARRIGRKTLFAVAGLVSVHDATWTTDRATAARRWGELHPDLAEDLHLLLALGDVATPASRETVGRLLGGCVTTVATSFEDTIGLWR